MPDNNTPAQLRTTGIAKPVMFSLKPDADERAALAAELGIPGIRKLTFEGKVSPEGARDLLLEATLGATVIQNCVVTLEPVTTRIDEPVTRRYLANMPDAPDAPEIEMPDDDTAEPLPDTIDLALVMTEALSLALPPWPRATGVEPVRIQVTETGKDPLSDDDVKPFAALKKLRDKLGRDDTENG
jgi:uncharacterized metal-binding protein YceD (DUF177 family)